MVKYLLDYYTVAVRKMQELRLPQSPIDILPPAIILLITNSNPFFEH